MRYRFVDTLFTHLLPSRLLPLLMKLSSARKLQVPARVLLVDDHPGGLSARRSVLQELGYEAISTTCPREALSRFRNESFDLVVTDYRMPEMMGTELILQLREINPKVPVILLTGFAEPLGLSEESTGADCVIMKSNHEVQQLIWAAGHLMKGPARRKPPRSARSAPSTRKNVSSS